MVKSNGLIFSYTNIFHHWWKSTSWDWNSRCIHSIFLKIWVLLF